MISADYSELNIINEELYPKIEKGFLYAVGTSSFYFIKSKAYREAKHDAMIKILRMTGQKNIINKIHPLKREFYYEVYNLTNKDTLKVYSASVLVRVSLNEVNTAAKKRLEKLCSTKK